jgi:flagellar biosynthesis/type III secretory pathway protein FliH
MKNKRHCILILLISCLCLTSCNDKNTASYNKGYQAGYNKGYEAGYEAGQIDEKTNLCQQCEDSAENGYQQEVCSNICYW